MSRAKWWTGGGVLALLALLVAVALAAGGSTADQRRPESLAMTDNTTSIVPSTVAPTSSPTTASTSSTTSTIPPDPLRTWVATARAEVPYLVAYDQPGGQGNPIPLEFLVPNPHQFGGPLTLMMTSGQPGDAWIQVQLPVRPNRQVGWVDASLYDIAGTRVRAEVNLTDRSVMVWDGEELIAQTQAVIGTDQTPTPLGTFSIAAVRENPPEESYLGPYALALSAFSEVHETFSGGIPVIAIHGTSRPDQVGQALSNGCVRIPNEVVTFLAENVPLGAPVTISA